MGYGDLYPRTRSGKIFTCFFVYMGIGMIAAALSYLLNVMMESNGNSARDKMAMELDQEEQAALRKRKRIRKWVTSFALILGTTLIGAMDSASSIPAPPMTSNSNPRRQFGSVRYERSDARLSFGSDLDAFFWIPLPTLIAHALTTVRVMAMTGMTLERADEGSRDARGALWGSRERARRRRTRRKLNGSSY